jgi:cytoskeleton protein RodZ
MASDQEHQNRVGPGEQLRRAREAMGRSPGDLAEELRLTVEQVHALEADDFARLPGEAYVRGYLRNYAAAVGLSPDEVMAGYEQRPTDTGEPPDENDTPLIPEPERPLIEHPWRVVWVSLALLVVVSVFTVWLVGESREPVVPDQAEAPAGESAGPEQPDAGQGLASDTAEDVPTSGTSGPGGEGEGGAPSSPQAVAPAASAGEDQALGLQGPTLTGPGLEEPSFPELPDPTGNGPSASPDELQTLRVHTWAKSWLEVADDRGRVLLRRLVPEGRDLRLYGQAPFQVKVGNAAGVQLYFEGAPLPSLGRPGQVVRLNVDADSRTIPESEVGPPEALAEARRAGEASDQGGGAGPGADPSAAEADTPKRPASRVKADDDRGSGQEPAEAADSAPAATEPGSATQDATAP